MMVLASGALDDLVILEAADFNAIGQKAAAMMGGAGSYQAPGGRPAEHSAQNAGPPPVRWPCPSGLPGQVGGA